MTPRTKFREVDVLDIKICCHNCKETSTYSVNLTTHIEVVRVVEEIPPPRIVSRTTVQNTPSVPAPQYILDIIEQRRIDAINAQVNVSVLRDASVSPEAWLTRGE